MMQRTRAVCAATLLLLLGVSATTCAQELKKDIVFTKVDGQELKLDLTQPKGKGPFPLIVWIHGGGWQAGSRKDFHDAMKGLTALGYVGASVEYRLAPKHKFPSQINDVRAALSFLRKNAQDYKIDAGRIGVLGGSAGGQLALLLGLSDEADKSTRIRCIVNIAGPTDLRAFQIPKEGLAKFRKSIPKDPDDLLADYLGTSDRKAKVMAEASPVTYIKKQGPPVLTVHGSADEIVPFAQAKLLHEALKKAGASERLFVVEGGGHNLGLWPADQQKSALLAAVEFLEQNLKGQ